MGWTPKSFQPEGAAPGGASGGYRPKSFQPETSPEPAPAPPQEDGGPGGFEGAFQRAGKAAGSIPSLGPLGVVPVVSAAIDGYRGEAPGALEKGARGFQAGAEQGITFDHGDELQGAVGALLGHGYERTRDIARKDYAEAEKGSGVGFGAGKLAGSMAGVGKLGSATKLASVGAKATGAGGVLARVAAAMGLGGIAGGLEGEGHSDAPLLSQETVDATKRGAGVGALAAGAGQALVGEPIRGVAGALGNRIASSDEGIGRAANEAIDSAEGRARQQAGEAVGAWENLHNARAIRNGAPKTAMPQRPMGIPPNAEFEDPLYVIQGLDPARAKSILVEKMRMLPEQADDFIAKEAAPYLKPSAPTAVGRPPGAPTAVMKKQGKGVMNELMERRVGNANRAIDSFVNNRVQVPSPTQAIGAAEDAANAAAGQELRKGVGNMAVGAGAAALGNPLGAGTYNFAQGARRLARAALSSPAVLNRLRGIPGAGRSIGNAAGRGTAALETTIYAMANDPAVAQELQRIDEEASAPESEEE